MTAVTRPPDLTIVVVSHNHDAYLDACLNSFAPGNLTVSLEAFVVDNVPSDDTAAIVGRHGWVTLIQNPRPQGFAANNNQVIRASNGRYVLVLNPDTVVHPGALEKLVSFMDAHPQVGICGPQLVYPDGRIQPSCRRFPTLGSVIARRTPFRHWLKNSSVNATHLMLDFDHKQTTAVDWMLGACLMARREFIQEAGMMDEGFFLYVEDIDWCYRAHRAGWQVMYVAEACLTHHHQGASDRKLFSRYSWHHFKGMWRYYRKHLAPGWIRQKE